MESPTDSFSTDTDSDTSSDNDTLEFFEKVYNVLSIRPKKKMVDRDCIHANEVLMKNYFVENPVYNAETFRDWFRLPKNYFKDCRRHRSKRTMVSRTLRRDGQTKFQERIYAAHETRWHFPGMLSSIDCTHIEWRNCPRELRGAYVRGDVKRPTIILEAVTSNDLWISHSYFGVPSLNNDINISYTSPLFQSVTDGTTRFCPFMVNGRYYRRGFLLVDCIYPSWSVFVKTPSFPVEVKEKNFKKLRESTRKDVERAFCILKGRWGILNRPVRAMDKKTIHSIVYACIILHNMLIKEDGRAISPDWVPDPPHKLPFQKMFRNEELHFRLRYDLIELVGSLCLEFSYSDED